MNFRRCNKPCRLVAQEQGSGVVTSPPESGTGE
jgi:hypothetical protein